MSRNYIVLTACFFIISTLGLTYGRYKSGLNFSSIHLQTIGPSDVVDSLKVIVQSPLGSTLDLKKHPTRKGLYVSPYAGPTASLVVTTKRSQNVNALTYELYCGQYFIGPVTKLEGTNLRPLTPEELKNGDRSGALITSDPLNSSILPFPSRCLNWQGDLALVAPPIATSGMITIALVITVLLANKIFRKLFTNSLKTNHHLTQQVAGAYFERATGAFTWLFGIFLFVVILHQTVHQVHGFLIALDAFQYVTTALIIFGLSSISIVMGYFVSRNPRNNRRFGGIICVVMVSALALKVFWILENPAIQINDYKFYWENACKMARGDWKELPNASTNNRAYVQRAFLYYYPIAAIFGPNSSVVPWCNLATQIMTLSLSAILAFKTTGRIATVVSLPLLIAFPEFWFGITIASHDVPAMLLLITFFLLFNNVFDFVGRHRGTVTLTALDPLRCLCALCLGVVSGMLDVQRTYWPILLVTVSSTGFYFSAIDFQRNKQMQFQTLLKTAMPFLISLFVITVMIFTSSSISRWIESKTGKLGSSTSVAYISGVDSATAAKWDEIGPWVYKYFPAIPDDLKSELALRRIIHEKFAQWNIFWGHIVRKNAEFADNTYTMYHAVHDKDQVSCWEDRIAWFEARKVYCCLWGFLLGGCFLFRLTLSCAYKLNPGEWLLFVFTCSGLVIELLLTEAVGVYDIFLAFPLCFSAGRLVEIFFQTDCRMLGADYLKLTRRSAISGLAGIACLLFFHAASGEAIRLLLPCFAVVHDIQQIESDRAGQIDALLDIDSLSFSASLTNCRSSEDGQLSWAGLAAIIEVPRTTSFLGGFLLTGNQRRDKQPFDDAWHDIPVTYEICVNSTLVTSGPLIDLVTPKFIRADDSWGSDTGRLLIELKLFSVSDWQVAPAVRPPSVCVEFPFFR